MSDTLEGLACSVRKALEAVEWSDMVDVPRGGEPRCPDAHCDNRMSEGHDPDCALAAALTAARSLEQRLGEMGERPKGWWDGRCGASRGTLGRCPNVATRIYKVRYIGGKKAARHLRCDAHPMRHPFEPLPPPPDGQAPRSKEEAP